jgi:RHS repeat-associated protein
LTSRSDYDAFGLQTGNASSNSIGYTGQRLDNETGLMALGNGERYYSPTYARFIQQDSVSGNSAMPQSLNRFSYATNNPNKFTDPTGHEGVVADGIRNTLQNNYNLTNNETANWWISFGANFVAGASYDATNLFTTGAFGMLDKNIQKAMRGEQITVSDMLTTNWYGGDQDGWNPGNFLKNEAIGFGAGVYKMVAGIATLAQETSVPMLINKTYQNLIDPVGEAEKRRESANSAVAGIKQWASDLYGGVTHPEEILNAMDAVGADKTAQILGEAEFDAAMIVDGGIGAVKGAKALNAMRVAKLERQALQTAIKESVELNVAESSAARSASKFSEYASKDNLIQTVIKDAEDLSTLSPKSRGPVVARTVDLDSGLMSQRYTNLKEMPSDLLPNLQSRANEANKLGLHFSDAGSHAEVLATNELLKVRIASGETVTNNTMKRFASYQYWLDAPLNPAKMCQNCSHILQEVNSMAGKK